jgi:hypothetical protein
MQVFQRFPYRVKDSLGREICGRCQQLLPSSAEAVELHFILHEIEEINRHLEWTRSFIERLMKAVADQTKFW